MVQLPNPGAGAGTATSKLPPESAYPTPEGFFRAVLKSIGAPITDNNLAVLRAWSLGEGTAAKFNPFATTRASGYSGDTAFNSFGPNGQYHVLNFASFDAGVKATADTLKQSNFQTIRNLLMLNAPAARTTQAIDSSAWGTKLATASLPAAQRGSVSTKFFGLDQGAAKPLGVVDTATGLATAGVGAVVGASGIHSIGDFLGKITSSSFWLKVGIFGLGVIIVMVGMWLLIRDSAAGNTVKSATKLAGA